MTIQLFECRSATEAGIENEIFCDKMSKPWFQMSNGIDHKIEMATAAKKKIKRKKLSHPNYLKVYAKICYF